jgi:hypothetical protein
LHKIEYGNGNVEFEQQYVHDGIGLFTGSGVHEIGVSYRNYGSYLLNCVDTKYTRGVLWNVGIYLLPCCSFSRTASVENNLGRILVSETFVDYSSREYK